MQPQGFLFDLDGVLVDTAKYHYLAWAALARELGIPFTRQDNERLKGVSRMRSLEIILELGGRAMSGQEKAAYCEKKNGLYLSFIQTLEQKDVLPGVTAFLQATREAGIRIALGSASKNARFILERLALTELFDAVIDGAVAAAAKPNPEVFLKGAEALALPPERCVVFEDSAAGIAAAHNGGMPAVGVGTPENLPEADAWIPGFQGLIPADIQLLLQSRRHLPMPV